MWVEADCNVPSGESLVRQFVLGKRFFLEEYGVETRDIWLPDVFGYSAALPQIMKEAGIDWFLTQKITWNDTNKFPHHTFWWQGIDGTRVFSHFPPADTYNGSAGSSERLPTPARNFKDHGRATARLYPFGCGDGGGGPTREHLERLAAGQRPRGPSHGRARWRRVLLRAGRLGHRGTCPSGPASSTSSTTGAPTPRRRRDKKGNRRGRARPARGRAVVVLPA